MAELTYVVAGSYAEFMDYEQSDHLHDGELFFVEQPNMLNGLQPGRKVWLVGSFRDRSDWFIVEEICRALELDMKTVEAK